MPNKPKRKPAGPFLHNIKVQPGDIVILLDQIGRITGWNDEAEQLLGYKAAEVKGLPWEGLFPYSGLNFKAVLAGRDFAGGFEAKRKDKTPVALYFFATARKDKTGTVTGIACIGRDVSPFWRPTEGALEQEKRYRLLLALSIDAIVVLSTRGQILEANPAAAQIAGLPVEQLIEQPVERFIHPERYREALAFWRSLLRKGKRQGTIMIRTVVGDERRLVVQAETLTTGRGKMVFALCRDMTPQIQIGTAWHEAEAKFRQVFELGEAARFIETLDGTIVEANAAGAQLFGLRREELIGRRLREIVPDELKALLPQIRTALLEQRHHQAEIVTRGRGGKQLWLSVSSSLVELKEQTLILTMIEDLTEERKAYIELQENAARLNLILSQVPAIVWQTDTKLRITSLSGSGLAALGVQPAEVVKKGIEALFGEKDDVEQAHHRALAGNAAVFEFSRQARVYQARVEPLRGVDAELLGVAGIAQDLSQKKQLVGQIQELLTHTRMVIQNAPHGIVIVDESDGRVVYANPAFAQLFGYEPEQVVGKPMMEMLPTYEQERFRGYQEARRQGKPAPAWYQFDGLCKDSTIRRMSISVVITYTVGDTPYLLGFINPVKEG